MTPKSDYTGKSGTLPLPELNPLLNPILNKNLGRWAEVYFTNPPEKREEAVIHLLRELESGTAPTERAPRSSGKKTETRNSSLPSKRNVVTCRDCGFQNEPFQKFCGDCGAQLSAGMMTGTATRSQPAETRREEPATAERRSPVNKTFNAVPQFGSFLHLSDPPSRLADGAGDRPAEDSSETLVSEVPQSVQLKGSYRAFIALVLVAIIGGLGYLAWRAGQSKTEASMLPPPAPPAATEPPSTPSSVPDSTSPETNSAPAAATANPEVRPISSGVAPDQKPQNAAKTEPLPVPKPPSSPNTSPALSANGSQELVTALSFLNGQQRDSAAAAQWLWKAVEKKNTAATVLLAGLYLRGDGVQKNCDQGRVLLDAAADKGNKDAAGLLRNLQAFGCQ